MIVVNFSNLLADGVSGSATTTTLYLKFDHDPVGLSLADITLTGASKVALTGSGRSRALTITGISVGNGGSVQVSLANPTGYVFAPTNSLTVPVFLDLLSPVEKREMVTVPGGMFTQTDTAGHDFSHTITGFKMGSYEVTYDLWYTVYQWALTQGYSFANPGCEGNSGTVGAAPTPSGKNQPVTTVNWRDAIVWCNAYSQMAGLIPVYCSDSGLAIQDSGDANALQCDYPRVKWDATGYRLPTEGEWQYAASYRDGTLWTPYNYAAGATASYTDAAATKQVAWYSANSGNTTKPVGQKDDNELDIYDMSGNVWEWCWDWHAAYLTTAQNDYRGPASGSSRIRRGGGCNNNATDLQVGYRVDDEPTFKYNDIGFRLAQR